jgi:hypothetical protein
MITVKKFILSRNEKEKPFSESLLNSPTVGIVEKIRLFVNNFIGGKGYER